MRLALIAAGAGAFLLRPARHHGCRLRVNLHYHTHCASSFGGAGACAMTRFAPRSPA